MPEFQTSDGISLYYEDRPGSKGTVLCLAGLTRNVRDFDYVTPHLFGYRLIALDARGRGKSEYDTNYLNYNVQREAQDVSELLDHLSITRCTVLGTSRGGLIGMVLAARDPKRLCGLILNDVGPILGASGIAQIMGYVGHRPHELTYADWVAHMKTDMTEEFPALSNDRWLTEAQHRFVEMPDGLHLRYDPYLRSAITDQSASEKLPDFPWHFKQLHSIPTGVIRGENSLVLTAEILRDMHAQHPGLISTVVPERGHAPFLDEPQSLFLIHTILDACHP